MMKVRLEIKNVTNIGTIVENIDITNLVFEWGILPTVFNDKQKKKLESLPIDEI
jgi:hypothetical protein